MKFIKCSSLSLVLAHFFICCNCIFARIQKWFQYLVKWNESFKYSCRLPIATRHTYKPRRHFHGSTKFFATKRYFKWIVFQNFIQSKKSTFSNPSSEPSVCINLGIAYHCRSFFIRQFKTLNTNHPINFRDLHIQRHVCHANDRQKKHFYSSNFRSY